MSATHLNLMTPIDRNGKTFWLKCGVFFPPRDGQKHAGQIRLDAFPANGELVAFEPKSTPESESET